MPFTLQLDPKTLEAAPGTPVKGVLWIAHGKLAFPAPGHRDAPVLVLGWWLEVAAGLLEGLRPAGVFGFMDGPFEVRVLVATGGGRRWALDLCERGKRRTSKTPRLLVSPKDFAAELLRAATRLGAACRKRGLGSSDLDTLATNRKRLQAALRARPAKRA